MFTCLIVIPEVLLCAVSLLFYWILFVVQESMEMIDNPLHEAAKRGNIDFLNECIGNRVCHHFLSYIHYMLMVV